ncbi:MAG: hypothetical protein LBE49_04130 [Deltaproteobacteria bacterium]|jgi:hypothetical protein|nr:hypothetical protein [Deltaproteobacteria bacterium]
MRLKRLAALALPVLVFCLFSAPLMADITLTAKDVDTFIKMANMNTRDEKAMEKLLTQSGRDKNSLEDALEKILGIISMIDQNETNLAEISDSLGEEVTRAEYNLVNKRKSEIMRAVAKMYKR